MSEANVTIGEHEVQKAAVDALGVARLKHEFWALKYLEESPHTPSLTTYKPPANTLLMERIDGRSFKEIFEVDAEWNAKAMPWAAAAPFLEQYVAAETDLLARGAMYRDLNLEHLIFTGDRAVLVDHEETVGNMEGETKWRFKSLRGTWETMAPEEFRGAGYLTERTATYRTAVLAHLALSGHLPFPRFESRSDVHHWRKRRAPEVSRELPKLARSVLRIALDGRRPERRHSAPARFFEALKSTYEEK